MWGTFGIKKVSIGYETLPQSWNMLFLLQLAPVSPTHGLHKWEPGAEWRFYRASVHENDNLQACDNQRWISRLSTVRNVIFFQRVSVYGFRASKGIVDTTFAARYIQEQIPAAELRQRC